MNSIEDQIDTFIDPDFNAEEAARQFFASNTENELSRKLNEMTGIQTSVEAILKQKVRQKDRKSTRLNSSHQHRSRMPSSA